MAFEDSVLQAYGGGELFIHTRCQNGGIYIPCDVGYIEIPITFPTFEVPLFTFKDFDYALENYDGQEAIVVRLFKGERVSRYTTVGRAMQDIILSRYRECALMPILAKQENNEIYYFATNGAVFDRHLNPLVICSWLVEMEERDDGWCFKLVKPILRISPQCYINKSNPMEKLIANKMIHAVLAHTVDSPTASHINTQFCSNTAKVEICDSPFHIKRPDTPSISTTTEELTSIAAEYLNEII